MQSGETQAQPLPLVPSFPPALTDQTQPPSLGGRGSWRRGRPGPGKAWRSGMRALPPPLPRTPHRGEQPATDAPDTGRAASTAPRGSHRGDGHPWRPLHGGRPGSALLQAPDAAERGRHPRVQGQSASPARGEAPLSIGGASRDCRQVPVLLLRLSPGPRALSAEAHLSIITEHTAPGASPFRARHLLVSAWA